MAKHDRSFGDGMFSRYSRIATEAGLEPARKAATDELIETIWWLTTVQGLVRTADFVQLAADELITVALSKQDNQLTP